MANLLLRILLAIPLLLALLFIFAVGGHYYEPVDNAPGFSEPANEPPLLAWGETEPVTWESAHHVLGSIASIIVIIAGTLWFWDRQNE